MMRPGEAVRLIVRPPDLFGTASALRRPEVFDPRFFPLYRAALCMCCRSLAHLLSSEGLRCLVVVERFARAEATFAELVVARDAAKAEARRVARRSGRRSAEHSAAEAVRDAGRNSGFEALLLSGAALERAGLPAMEQLRVFAEVAGVWPPVGPDAAPGTSLPYGGS